MFYSMRILLYYFWRFIFYIEMGLTKKQAEKNIKLYWLISLISGITFLVPIISIFYKYTWLSTFEIILISNIFTLWMWIFELPTSVLWDTFWRKKSLLASIVCNFLCTLFVLLCPNLVWFCIAAWFTALYYSFWSWTSQAFLEENLSKMWKEDKFWKFFGNFTFYWQIPAIFTPIVSSIILKCVPSFGYTILAILDCIFAFILVILAYQFTETYEIKEKIKSFKQALILNINTWKNAIKDVFSSKDTRNFLIYRSFSHHVKFFEVLLLPILSEKGMIDWVSWIITTLFVIWSMFASKYTYKRWEKYWYNRARAWSTVWEAVCLIIAWIFFKSWIFLAIVYFSFSIFDGIVRPAYNHELVKISKWRSIATTRSIMSCCVALYMTIMKLILSYVQPNFALIILWILILVTNIIFAKQMLHGKDIQASEK